MAKCTGKRCPMQRGYKCDECNLLDCRWRAEPQTHADRIRAMSDKELAEFLSNPCDCTVIPEIDGYRECGNKLCIQYLLKWLKQPLEDTE